MKVNELRLNNWIFDNISNSAVKVNCVILRIICQEEDVYSPIELTKEILLKAGFEEDDHKSSLLLCPNGFIFVFQKNGIIKFCGITFSHKRKIETVHKLQNIYFALTNEELKIEL